MYTISELLGDLAQSGPLKAGDYQEVWDAFNRYVTDAIGRKTTLSVLNFCKIGWKYAEGMHYGRARLRPHFQLSDTFVQTYGIDQRADPPQPDRQLAPCEDFNFSKAAIRYSQSLTKEVVFMGLRGIIQRLGEVMQAGRAVSIDFEVGKLQSQERQVSFNFVAQLYIREGLEAPNNAADEADYKPSATFAPPSQDAMTLSLRGNNAETLAAGRSSSAHGRDGIRADLMMSRPIAVRVAAAQREADGDDDPAAATASDMAQAGKTRMEHVHDAFMNNYISGLQGEALEAIHQREVWKEHVDRCAEEELKDRLWRKALAKDYGQQLLIQMQQREDRRTEGRRIIVDQASTHGFPDFRRAPERAVYDYIRQRQGTYHEDLNQQVDTKQRLKTATKQRELEWEIAHNEATQAEQERLDQEKLKEKVVKREKLREAWDYSQRMRKVRQAIEDQRDGKDVMSKPQDGKEAAWRKTVDLGLPGISDGQTVPPLNLGLTSRSGAASPAPSSRPPTGSARRQPIGAAASLALHKRRTSSSGGRRR